MVTAGFFLQKKGTLNGFRRDFASLGYVSLFCRFSLGLDFFFCMFYMHVLQEYSLYFRWIIIEMKHAERSAPLNAESLKK